MKRTIFILTAISAAVLAPAVQAVERVPASFPAAGELTVEAVTVRSQPSYDGRRVAVLREFRRDYRPQVVLATGSARDAQRRLWLRVPLQLRPNGTVGWIPASAAALRPMRDRIVVDRSARTIDLFRDGHVLLHARVAVGAPGWETPLGQFYVTARFVPDDPFLGVFAFETSAYSKLTDWPGGGIVGIHGTSAPQLIGQAISHGCVRVTNRTARQLQRYVRVGTPISIVD
jgi:lipoprotein-anchoring transpeptidase ErfK/SrfK